MPLRAYLATLVLAVSSTIASAGTTAYGIAFDTLYSIDLSGHTAERIGAAGIYGTAPLANIEGLTYSPDGQLYAVSDTTLKVLMQINPSTGQATVVGPLGGASGLGDQGAGTFGVLDLGMAFTCDGKLWLSSGYTGSLWEVDPATAAVTKVGNLGVTITGLAASGSTLLGAGSGTSPNLYAIDTATAAATVVGAYNSDAGPITTASPGVDSAGQLWALLDDVPPLPPIHVVPEWSTLVQINATGSMTTIAPITGPQSLQFVGIKGLAIAPPTCSMTGHGPTFVVHPAPALSPAFLLGLVALLLLAAGTRLRRRRQTP
jgi:hypothetical protein